MCFRSRVVVGWKWHLLVIFSFPKKLFVPVIYSFVWLLFLFSDEHLKDFLRKMIFSVRLMLNICLWSSNRAFFRDASSTCASFFGVVSILWPLRETVCWLGMKYYFLNTSLTKVIWKISHSLTGCDNNISSFSLFNNEKKQLFGSLSQVIPYRKDVMCNEKVYFSLKLGSIALNTSFPGEWNYWLSWTGFSVRVMLI